VSAEIVQRPLPFIVGSGRSGTTLLRAILGSHPDLAIPPETHFVGAGAYRRGRYEGSHGLNVGRFLTDMGPVIARDLQCEFEEVRDAVLSARPPTYADAIRAVFAMYARRHGKPRYGNKSPVHALSVQALATLLPEARFIHIIRDGRDVVLSYLDVPFGPASLEEAALKWKRYIRRGRAGGRAVGPDRYLEVRYEALISAPEAVVRQMCEFVELPFDDRMLRYHEETTWLFGKPVGREHRNLLKPPSRVRDWRQQMSPDRVAAIELIAGDTLSELGYELGDGHRSMRTRLRTRGRVARLEATRVARGVGKRVFPRHPRTVRRS
jgi:hypothetical protein